MKVYVFSQAELEDLRVLEKVWELQHFIHLKTVQDYIYLMIKKAKNFQLSFQFVNY